MSEAHLLLKIRTVGQTTTHKTRRVLVDRVEALLMDYRYAGLNPQAAKRLFEGDHARGSLNALEDAVARLLGAKPKEERHLPLRIRLAIGDSNRFIAIWDEQGVGLDGLHLADCEAEARELVTEALEEWERQLRTQDLLNKAREPGVLR